MLNRQQQFGQESEQIAVRLLKKRRYKILAQNYRSRFGEIDIIARHRDTIVFVEVKARNSGQFGNPKWAVTPQKQRRISMTALMYLKATGQSDAPARFDVVSILSGGKSPQVEIIQNAFDVAFS